MLNMPLRNLLIKGCDEIAGPSSIWIREESALRAAQSPL